MQHSRHGNGSGGEVIVFHSGRSDRFDNVPIEEISSIFGKLNPYRDKTWFNPYDKSNFTPKQPQGSVAAMLRLCRLSRRFTQRDLAILAGVTQSNISQIENGTRHPGKILAKRLARALNTDYRRFL